MDGSVYVSVMELRVRLGQQPLPQELIDVFQREQIERPTFGQWRNMLEAIVQHLEREPGLVVSELVEFAEGHLLPELCGAA